MGAAGSSPLTRGAPTIHQAKAHQPGLIPAYAGSTLTPHCCAREQRAHPRLRGEHTPSRWLVLGRQGSSPLTRGALRPTDQSVLDEGLIPAYAGSTGAQFTEATIGSAHPRLRGEHLRLDCDDSHLKGSSPLTRGARVGDSPAGVGVGLIPAYAGSTRDTRV